MNAQVMEGHGTYVEKEITKKTIIIKIQKYHIAEIYSRLEVKIKLLKKKEGILSTRKYACMLI